MVMVGMEGKALSFLQCEMLGGTGYGMGAKPSLKMSDDISMSSPKRRKIKYNAVCFILLASIYIIIFADTS